jgi:putative ABC transport system substrate-binding protein
MRRREFITLIGGAAVAWPIAVRAQQPATPVIGFLSDASPGPYAPLVAAFHQGLKETGFVEAQNVAIEYRWAEGQHDRLSSLAADLVRRQVAVIVCFGGNFSAPAAKAATTTIPIIFAMGGDPVEFGLVASLNRPGGNITGVSQLTSTLLAKQLELLHELVPTGTVIGMLVNPDVADIENQLKNVREAARALGLQIVVGQVRTEGEFDTAFQVLVQQHTNAVLISGGAFFTSLSGQLATSTIRYRLPAIYVRREFAAAGGLMSYGTSLADVYRQVGIYTGRVLKGEKPADLPVLQPTKFDLVINRKTAKVLGLTIPPTLLATADELIE